MHIRRCNLVRNLAQPLAFAVLVLTTAGLLCYLLSLIDGRSQDGSVSPDWATTMPPRIVYNKEVNLQRMLLEDGVRNYKDCLRFNEMAIALKDCLKSILLPMKNQDYFANISDVAAECGTEYLRRLFGGKFLLNRDDVKMLMLPKSNSDHLVALTLGIGDDISAELKIKSMFKNIKFYGADPILESGRVYEEIGQYIQAGVGLSTGTMNASVFEDREYHRKIIDVITIPELMKHFGLDFVDFLLLDVEGAEFSLFPHLMDIEDLTFCQVNVEIHGPLANYNAEHKTFANLVRSMLKPSSRFIPLWIPTPTMHHRFFLVDWKTPRCVQKFFSHWC